MKTDILKKLIKEAVREAIQDELKDILLEAVRSPKQVVTETVQPLARPVTTTPSPDVRNKYSSLLDGMMSSGNGNLSMTSGDAMSFGATQGYNPPRSANTTGEGSSLPAGEVSLDQIAGLLRK